MKASLNLQSLFHQFRHLHQYAPCSVNEPDRGDREMLDDDFCAVTVTDWSQTFQLSPTGDNIVTTLLVMRKLNYDWAKHGLFR